MLFLLLMSYTLIDGNLFTIMIRNSNLRSLLNDFLVQGGSYNKIKK